MTVTLLCTRATAGRILAYLHEADPSSRYSESNLEVSGDAVLATFTPDGHDEQGALIITSADPLDLLQRIYLDDGTPVSAGVEVASFDADDAQILADAYEREADRIEQSEPGYPSDPKLVVLVTMLRQAARLLRDDGRGAAAAE